MSDSSFASRYGHDRENPYYNAYVATGDPGGAVITPVTEPAYGSTPLENFTTQTLGEIPAPSVAAGVADFFPSLMRPAVPRSQAGTSGRQTVATGRSPSPSWLWLLVAAVALWWTLKK